MACRFDRRQGWRCRFAWSDPLLGALREDVSAFTRQTDPPDVALAALGQKIAVLVVDVAVFAHGHSARLVLILVAREGHVAQRLATLRAGVGQLDLASLDSHIGD